MEERTDLSHLKWQELMEQAYDMMNLMASSNRLSSWADLNKAVGKDRKRVYERYLPRLVKEHPGSKENTEKIIEYVKTTGLVRGQLPSMDEIMKWAMTPDRIKDMFRAEIANQIHGNVATKVKLLLDSMENDLLVSRQMTLQACMLAITGYRQSLQERVKAWLPIGEKEFKTAYDIYKTEMWEPITIKETRHKTMQVTLQVPISKEEVTHILGKKITQDLSIEVADEFKDKLESKFNLNQHTVNDESRWDNSEAGDDRVITEAEEIPNEPTIQ